MSKLVDFLKSVAVQSGVSETEIKEILDNPALTTLEFSADVSTKLNAPRMSMDAAKNNPDLKKHFTALTLNGVDAELERTFTELGLDELSINEIKGLDSTTKRVNALAKKVKDLESAKAGKGSADTEKLNKTIEELNNQILAVKQESQNALAQKDASLEVERVDYSLNSILSNYDYSTPVDKDINVNLGKSLLNKALQEKGLKITRENNALVLKTAEGTDYFDNNVKVGVQDFTTKTLANAKVLKASGSSTPASTPHKTQISEGNTFKNAESIIAELGE